MTTTPLKQKAAAQKSAGHGKPRSNAAKKPAAKKSSVPPRSFSPSGPRPRLTTVWKDSSGKDVPMKATVRFEDRAWTVKSRFTGREREPYLALAPKTGKDKKGKHTPAKSVTLA